MKHYMKRIFFTIVVNQQLHLIAKEVKAFLNVVPLPCRIQLIELNYIRPVSTAVAGPLKLSRATAVLPCHTAEVRLGFKRRATAVPNSIYTLQLHLNKQETF